MNSTQRSLSIDTSEVLPHYGKHAETNRIITSISKSNREHNAGQQWENRINEKMDRNKQNKS